MAKLRVTTKYDITVHDLLQEERKTNNSFFKQRLMSIYLVIDGYSATSAAPSIGFVVNLFLLTYKRPIPMELRVY